MSFKILFMGTPDFAVPILKSIFHSKHKILEVYTQPPKKQNRGQKIQNSPIHKISEKFNISVRCPVSLNTKEELDHLKDLRPDIAIVVAYGKIIPANFLNLEIFLYKYTCLLLPKWRGAAPIQRAIMNMDQETGVSIMKIISKLDAGPVLTQSKIKISKDTNYEELSTRMSKIGSEQILNALDLIESNQANFIKQNDAEATYANKILKTESKIQWNENADKVIAKINAFYPNPGCWFKLNGSRIKIIKAKEVVSEGKPGTIIDKKFTIACSKNAVQILELKKEGKQKMSIDEFLRGYNLKIGQILN